MRVLYLGYYDAGCASLTTKYYLRKALGKIDEVICYGPEGFNWGHGIDVKKLEKIYKPDVVLLQGRYVAFKWPRPSGRVDWKNLSKLNVPVAYMFNEICTALKPRIDWINKNHIDMSLWVTHCYMQKHKKLFFEKHKVRWLPWSADTDVFKDYSFSRRYDVAILGSFSPKHHPLRVKMRRELTKIKGLSVLLRPRPPFSALRLNPKTAFIHENYAKAIANSKMIIFDTSKTLPNIAVKKFFEGMACNTLVLSETPMDAKRLHFKPFHNFVPINEKNFVKMVKHYKKKEKARKRIALNGRRTIEKYHSSRVRAKQLHGYLEEMLK